MVKSSCTLFHFFKSIHNSLFSQKKIVISVPMMNDKKRARALQIAVGFSGKKKYVEKNRVMIKILLINHVY